MDFNQPKQQHISTAVLQPSQYSQFNQHNTPKISFSFQEQVHPQYHSNTYFPQHQDTQQQQYRSCPINEIKKEAERDMMQRMTQLWHSMVLSISSSNKLAQDGKSSPLKRRGVVSECQKQQESYFISQMNSLNDFYNQMNIKTDEDPTFMNFNKSQNAQIEGRTRPQYSQSCHYSREVQDSSKYNYCSTLSNSPQVQNIQKVLQFDEQPNYLYQTEVKDQTHIPPKTKKNHPNQQQDSKDQVIPQRLVSEYDEKPIKSQGKNKNFEQLIEESMMKAEINNENVNYESSRERSDLLNDQTNKEQKRQLQLSELQRECISIEKKRGSIEEKRGSILGNIKQNNQSDQDAECKIDFLDKLIEQTKESVNNATLLFKDLQEEIQKVKRIKLEQRNKEELNKIKHKIDHSVTSEVVQLDKIKEKQNNALLESKVISDLKEEIFKLKTAQKKQELDSKQKQDHLKFTLNAALKENAKLKKQISDAPTFNNELKTPTSSYKRMKNNFVQGEKIKEIINGSKDFNSISQNTSIKSKKSFNLDSSTTKKSTTIKSIKTQMANICVTPSSQKRTHSEQ